MNHQEKLSAIKDMGMTSLPTGLGVTEFVLRPSPNNVPRPPSPTCHLERCCADSDPRGCGACLRQAVESAKHEGLVKNLELALHHRRQFWMDTCREIREMRNISCQVMDLYRKHGCRFCTPGASQVQSVLEALDAALADWDCEHPELFFGALELNFPQLLRRHY